MTKKILGVGAAVLLAIVAAPASATPISLELALLVDVSGSIDDDEFALQRQGYVQAFTNLAGQYGGGSDPSPFVTTLVYWSGASEQVQSLGWTLINDAVSALAFAADIGGTTRPYDGWTAPGSAIAFGQSLFANNYEGDRLVMDVSGDGEQNRGISTSGARDAAALAGITINGLAIGDATLATWYQNNVVTNDGFLVTANDFGDFAQAVDRKITREVTGVPEPGAMMLLGTALLGLAAFRRRDA